MTIGPELTAFNFNTPPNPALMFNGSLQVVAVELSWPAAAVRISIGEATLPAKVIAFVGPDEMVVTYT